MDEKIPTAKTGLVLGIVMLLVVCSLGVIAAPARAAIVPEWTAAPDMGDTRTQAVVVSDANGLVYVMGGVPTITSGNYDNAVANASSYDPDTGAWTPLEPMLEPVRGAAGVLGQDGRVYVIGGYHDVYGAVEFNQIYDPVSNSWVYGAPMPEARWEAKAVAIQDDTIVVAGGEPIDGAVFRYDIGDDSWSYGTSMPTGMCAGAFVSDGFYSFFLGGVDSSYTAQAYTFIYYPWDSWGWMSDMPTAVAGHAAALATDGMIYVFGGGNSDSNVEAGRAAGFVMDRNTWDWTSLPDMAVPAKYLGGVATPDGRVLAVGGNDATTVMDKVESMRAMSLDVDLSAASVGAGDSILVTVTMDFAFSEATSQYATPYLMSSDDVIYGLKEVWSPGSYAFAFEFDVPESIPPGAYDLVLGNVYANFESGSQSLTTDFVLPVTVLGVNTIEEQLAMLEANISALQMATIQAMIEVNASTMAYLDAQLTALTGVLLAMGLAMEEANASTMAYLDAQLAMLAGVLMDMGEAMEEANASTMAYLNTQLTILQGVLAQLGNGLITMGAGQAAAMDALNETLDNFQEQIDRVEDKADTAGTYGIITLVLMVVVILLLAMMLFMARKKP